MTTLTESVALAPAGIDQRHQASPDGTLADADRLRMAIGNASDS
jgi:hypothetical protein